VYGAGVAKRGGVKKRRNSATGGGVSPRYSTAGSSRESKSAEDSSSMILQAQEGVRPKKTLTPMKLKLKLKHRGRLSPQQQKQQPKVRSRERSELVTASVWCCLLASLN